MSTLSPEKFNGHSNSILLDDDFDMTFNEPPSSPFVSHIDNDDQENIAPRATYTPVKPLLDFEDDVPQSAFRVSPEKKFGLKERPSPAKMSPAKNLMDDFEEAALKTSTESQSSPKKSSPAKQPGLERSESFMSSRSRKSQSPTKFSRAVSADSTQHVLTLEDSAPISSATTNRLASPHKDVALRDNEGLTMAIKYTEIPPESHENLTTQNSHEDDIDLYSSLDNTDFNPDGLELTSGDVDDTCFSNFSEMPGLDMTKFAFLKQNSADGGPIDVSTLAKNISLQH